MQSSRLLSILISLQAQGRRTAGSLAEELEVSVRTIYRDIDALSAAGVPVYAERGASGGFRLLDGFRTRLTGMTAPEARTLLLTGLPGPAMQMGLADAHFATRLKLLASLPEALRDEAVRIGARFHLDTAAWNPEETSLHLLPDLARAVWEQRRTHIEYRSWTKDSARLMDPLGLVLKAGTWYLIARHSGRVLTYRLSAIRSAQVTGTPFERDPAFDLAAHWKAASDGFVARLTRDWARLRVRAETVERLRLISAAVAQNLEVVANGAAPAGWREVRIPIESVAHATVELLRFGANLEVIAPAELRTAMRRTIRKMTSLYEEA
jgi:predicted DNA-binding transcriptional regulator YafY